MSKTIKDYLPYYLGQDVNYPIDGSPFKLIGITERGSLLIKGDFSGGTHNVNQVGSTSVENIKIRLRPLGDITREEAIVIASFAYTDLVSPNDKERIGKNWVKYNFLNQGLSGCEAELTQEIEMSMIFDITHYLLKQGFDMFGLIEAGLAVDKTKQ